MKKGIVLASVLILMLALSSMAQAPDSFVYQGRLTDASGNPIATTTAVTFRLYTAITEGSLIHSWNNVSVSPDGNGVFAAELTNMDRNDFVAGNKLYIELVIGGNPLTPRQLLTSVPYAYSAEYVANLANNSVTSANIVNNSITSVDVLDEPGIAYSINEGSASLATSMTDIVTVTITTPAAGYIDVEGTCFIMFSGTTGPNQAIFQIDQTAGGSYILKHETRAGLDAYTVSTDNVFPVYATRLYSVAAGTYTFRLEGMAQQGAPASALAWYGKIKATYFPTSYGTVATAAENNNDNNEQSYNTNINPNTGLIDEAVPAGTQEK